MRRLLAAAFVLPLLAQAPAAQEPVAFDLLLRRMFEYAERFQRELGSMVAEEKYDQVQLISAASRNGDLRRTLRSDFLLVNVPGHGWTPFRDVFEVDGRQIRDRQDRLTKLFLSGTSSGALEQAKRIMDEGARYNIGGGFRNTNVPLLAFLYFTPDARGGVRFVEARGDRGKTRVVEFSEIAHPTLITTSGDRDLPASGRIWVDEATGTITRTQVEMGDDRLSSGVNVTFGFDEKVQSWVPQRMEDYIRPRRDAAGVTGVATYSKFRRFQVTTSEDVATDQVDKPSSGRVDK